MPLSYLVNEDSRGVLGDALTHPDLGIDFVRVGDSNGPPLGMLDPEILCWAEEAGRILISRDKRTLGIHLQNHLRSGRHSPGVFLIRPGCRIRDLVAFLVEIAFNTDAEDWVDRDHYFP